MMRFSRSLAFVRGRDFDLDLYPMLLKKKKHETKIQIKSSIQRHEKGEKINDICRDIGISDKTFFVWRKKYSGLEVQDLKRLKSLEEENSKLKRLVAEQALDLVVLKDIVSKKW